MLLLIGLARVGLRQHRVDGFLERLVGLRADDARVTA